MTNFIKTTAIASLVISAMFSSSAFAGNQIIGGFGSSSIQYDPFSDHTTINNNNEVFRKSFLDSNRNIVDPGSFRRVDRTFQDSSGRWIREHGTKWTTNGKPHGRLTRENSTTYYPPVIHNSGVFVHQPGTFICPTHNPQMIHPQFNGGTTFNNGTIVNYSKTTMRNNRRTNRNSIYRPNGGVTQNNRSTVRYAPLPGRNRVR